MKSLLRTEPMDSDSDSPFNYSWPSFPKMRMRRKMGKKGKALRRQSRRRFTSPPSSSSFPHARAHKVTVPGRFGKRTLCPADCGAFVPADF